MRIVITGAQGFIGRHLVAEWLAAASDVSIVGIGRSPRRDDRFTHEVTWRGARRPARTPASLVSTLQNERYQYVPIDMSDTAALTSLMGELRPDVVVHLAASLRDEPPDRLVRTNVGAVVSLIDAVVGSGIDPPRLVLGSSGSVYGVVEARPLPLREDAPCAPIDPYSVSKRAAEDMSRVLAAQHGLDMVWARIFNPVGAGQDERHLCGWLGQQVASIRSGRSEPVIDVGPLDTTRDYIDIWDTASALRTVAMRGDAGSTYNVASGVEVVGHEILSGLLSAGGLDGVEVRTREGRRSDMPRHFADISRLRGLGWAPEVTLDESLQQVVAYYLETIDPAVGVATSGRDEIERTPLVLRPDRTHRYPVEVEAGLLSRVPAILDARFPAARRVVLTDSGVHERYAGPLAEALGADGASADLIVVPQGERSKAIDTFTDVVERLYALGLDRRSVLVCVGGGMITDLGGFVASAYLRGIPYVNVPTTLLAQHDSSIGGKVAVNTPWAKNFVGAFHHPVGVYCDPLVLATLSDRDLRCGVAESIKVALCGAPGLFELLEDEADAVERRDPAVLEEVVRRSAEHKIALLAPDPYEIDLRRALNLGHTYGHALEVEMSFDGILHGEAVGVGLVVATEIARARDLISPSDAARVIDLVDRYRIVPELEPGHLRAATKLVDEVRLVRAGRLNYVLPTSIRSVTIVPDLPTDEVLAAVDAMISGT